MVNMYEDAGRVGREAMNSALKSVSVLSAGIQQIASETSAFTRRSYEQQTTLLARLMRARTMDTTLEVQNEFAKSAYQNWVSQATKLGEIYADMAREAFKPFEQAALGAYGRGAERAHEAGQAAGTASRAVEKQTAP